METQFQKAIVPEEAHQLIAFDREVFPRSDLLSAEQWKQYETYWMIVDGTKVGCCAFQTDVDFQDDLRRDGVNPRLKGSLYISTAAILPAYRGSGLGRLFMCWQIAYARYHGYRRIVTNTRERNLPIVALTRELGFQVIRTTPGYYSSPTDATIVMEFLLEGRRRS